MPDHHAKRPEHHFHRRAILGRDGVEPGQRCIQIVFQDQGTKPGDLHRMRHALRLIVRNAEQDQRRARGVTLVVPFHGHDLGRLMFERIQAMLIAHEYLHRRDQGRHPHGHGKHLARVLVLRVAQQVPRAHRAHRERGGQVRGDHGVHQAIRKTRIEDDGQPTAPRGRTARQR